MSATILPPPPGPADYPKGLRLWVYHPRANVAPKLVRVLRVIKGKGVVVILNDNPKDPPNLRELGCPVAWFSVPPDAESVDV